MVETLTGQRKREAMNTLMLRTTIDLIPPRVRLAKRAMQSWYSGEPELRLLPYLFGRHECVVDVGANYGVYSWHARSRAKRVIAFEPQPELVAFLQRALGPQVQVEHAALSENSGEVVLRVPDDRMQDGRATLEEDNDLGLLPAHEIQVPCRRLDDYDLSRIGFIKIDVEGHELAVINGGWGMISRDLPHLLVEAEERHRKDALASVARRLAELGYGGYFLRAGALVSIDHPDQRDGAAGGQPPPGVNNFLFLAPRPWHDHLRHLVKKGRLLPRASAA